MIKKYLIIMIVAFTLLACQNSKYREEIKVPNEVTLENKILTVSPEDIKMYSKSKFFTLNILNYSLGKYIVSGQHNKEPNSNPNQTTNIIKEITGKYPGLWSGDFLFSESDIENRWTMIYEAEKQWNEGALINIMYHASSPLSETGSSMWESSDGVVSSLTDKQWRDLTTDGGELNKKWKKRLDDVSIYLQYLQEKKVEVMFRPFHEMNQEIFWWGGRPGVNGTAKLFELTRDYLENEKGLKNLIWVWDMQDLDLDFEDYKPKDTHWDIMALDIYNGDGYTEAKYRKMLEVSKDKPIAIGESYVMPSEEILTKQPKWQFFMIWPDELLVKNKKSEILKVYNSKRVLTRDDMKILRNQFLNK